MCCAHMLGFRHLLIGNMDALDISQESARQGRKGKRARSGVSRKLPSSSPSTALAHVASNTASRFTSPLDITESCFISLMTNATRPYPRAPRYFKKLEHLRTLLCCKSRRHLLIYLTSYKSSLIPPQLSTTPQHQLLSGSRP